VAIALHRAVEFCLWVFFPHSLVHVGLGLQQRRSYRIGGV
jgi:hypothetical protein